MIKGKWGYNYNTHEFEVDWDFIGTVGIFGENSMSMRRVKAIPWTDDEPFEAHLKARRQHRMEVFFKSLELLDGGP